MKKSIKHLYASMSDHELSDLALSAMLKIPTFSQVESRATRVRKMVCGADTKVGKRCTKISRCGSLGCAICRRRIQFSLMAVYTQPIATALESKKKGGA